MSPDGPEHGPPTTTPAASRALDRSLLGGLAWTGAARWMTQLLSWASTIVVARLLTVADYGIIGMATVYLGLVQLVNEFGLSASVVQIRDLDADRRARLGGLSVLLGAGFFLVSAALAVPIARFFGEPEVRWVVVALATTFLITGFRVLPNALLTRDLSFRTLARIDAVEAVLQVAVTLTLAATGFRYWSLVIGSIAGATVSTVLTVAARPHRLARPADWRGLVEPVTLGWRVTVSRVAWYAYTNADFAIVGRVLGKGALGAYTFGWTIASIPVDKIGAVLGRVVFPVFSAVQDDRAALGRYVRGMSEGLAIVTFPLTVGLALVADEFVLLALGEHWRAAIVPLRLLSLYAGFRCLMMLLPSILVAAGHARHNMRSSLAMAAVMPLLFWFGTRWGTAGVAWAWILGYPALAVPLLARYTLRHTGLTAAEYLGALRPALEGTAVMAAAVLLAGAALPAGLPLGAVLAAKVVAGAAAYLAVAFLVHGDRVRAFREVLREVRG